MRTDSVNLSDEALENSKNVIESNYGNDYLKRRVYKTKSNSVQEAHEAIRPTNFSLDNAGKTETEKKTTSVRLVRGERWCGRGRSGWRSGPPASPCTSS